MVRLFFHEMNKSEGFVGGSNLEGPKSKKEKLEDNGNHSDKGDEDEEEEESRKVRLGLNRKSSYDDDEDGGKADDMDDDDIEKVMTGSMRKYLLMTMKLLEMIQKNVKIWLLKSLHHLKLNRMVMMKMKVKKMVD
ncbi:hypothetical protein HPP92_001520 [Vanilla planifolia]|uniref:Uncharacterized protein n=1 Tax=Vanilla planifolia TaxID=51239 RepID=A0A835S2N7_VANPL|nr:hypothetical protein HPP92_001520 [Vanilla planifolia]